MEGWSQNIQYYALIFARVIALLMTAPVISTPTVSTRLRVALGLLLSAILYPVASNYLPELPKGLVAFVLSAAGQALVGIIIGFFITVIFTSFQIIGEVLSIQMGISFSEVLDPQSQVSLPLLATLKNAIGMLLFLAVPFQMDGHYMSAFMHMIRALGYSFETVPELVPSVQVLGGILGHLDIAFGVMLVTALKIGIPLVGILFISSLTLGILGRAAPQMNLINMGIQINILVGMLVLLTLIPVLAPIMLDTFSILYEKLGSLFSEWSLIALQGTP